MGINPLTLDPLLSEMNEKLSHKEITKRYMFNFPFIFSERYNTKLVAKPCSASRSQLSRSSVLVISVFNASASVNWGISEPRTFKV